MSKGWKETTLGEVCRLVKGISYKSSELVAEGEGIPFINLKSIDRGGGFRAEGLKWFRGNYKREQLVQAGDLVLCCTDLTKEKAILGYPLLVPKLDLGNQFCISLDMANLIVEKDMSTNEFMYLMLQGGQMREFMTSNSSGTTVMHLQTRNVGSAKVLLPPLAEQKRIVDVVSSVDTYIDALQRKADTARTVFLAVCEGIFSTEENLKPLHEVATVIMGQSPEGNTCNTDGIGTPLLTGPTEFTNVTVGPPRQWTSKETKLSQSGDILFCVRGATAGRINIGNYQSVIGRGLAAIRCKTHEDTDLVRYALTVGLGQLLPAAGGTIFPNISQAQLRNFEVSWPSEIRRVELSALLKSIEVVFLSTEQAVIDAKYLRSGLLSDLLSGEHEIPASYDSLLGAA